MCVWVHAHVCTHAHMPAHAHMCVNTLHTHTIMHTNTHIHTHAHTHTHTHTHRHTHTLFCCCLQWLCFLTLRLACWRILWLALTWSDWCLFPDTSVTFASRRRKKMFAAPTPRTLSPCCTTNIAASSSWPGNHWMPQYPDATSQ